MAELPLFDQASVHRKPMAAIGLINLIGRLGRGTLRDLIDNDQQQVRATFIDDTNRQPLFVLTNKPDQNYFELGIGVAAQFAKGRSAFLSYNRLLGYQDVTYNAVNAGMRLEF